MTEREAMLKNVMQCDFTVYEAVLYLDNHPDSQPALEYYHAHCIKAEEARREYEDRYGPLTAGASINNCRWDWTDGPWPWEVV